VRMNSGLVHRNELPMSGTYGYPENGPCNCRQFHTAGNDQRCRTLAGIDKNNGFVLFVMFSSSYSHSNHHPPCLATTDPLSILVRRDLDRWQHRGPTLHTELLELLALRQTAGLLHLELAPSPLHETPHSLEPLRTTRCHILLLKLQQIQLPTVLPVPQAFYLE
jgi:hypothetical protein